MKRTLFALLLGSLIWHPMYAFARTEFEIYPKVVSVEDAESEGDLFGALNLSWDDFREQLAANMTSDEKERYKPLEAALTFTVKRRREFGNDNYLREDYYTDGLAEVVMQSSSATSFSDHDFGKQLGYEPIHYWIEGVGIDPWHTNDVWKVHGHVKARNQYCISIGVSGYDPKYWKDEAERMAHAHDGREANLFSQLSPAPSGGPLNTCYGGPYSLHVTDLTDIFKAKSQSVKPGDIVSFFLATHGNQKDFALWDARCPSSQLAEWVSLFKGKGVRFFGVLNMCHAGAHIQQFKAPEYGFSAWVAAAKGLSEEQEIAGCFNKVSGFGRTFLEWGLRDGYGKLSHLHTVDDKWVATDADLESEYLSLYEAAHYAELMWPGASSKFEQHIEYVRPELLKKAHVKKVDTFPTPRHGKDDQPNGPVLSAERHDTLKYWTVGVQDLKDAIFQLQWMEKSFHTFWAGEFQPGEFLWSTAYSALKVEVFTEVQYRILHNTEKREPRIDEVRSSFFKDKETYVFRGKIMFPTGWSKAGKSISLDVDNNVLSTRYLFCSGKLCASPTVQLGDGLTLRVDINAVDMLREGTPRVGIDLVLNDGEDRANVYRRYGRISVSGDSLHFDASDEMSSLKQSHPWLDIGDDAFYFTITPMRVSGHICGKDFKAPLRLRDDCRDGMEPWEGEIPTLGVHTKEFDGTEKTPWDEDEKWKPDSREQDMVTLFFDPNGGVCTERRRTARKGTGGGAFPVPTRAGYAFDGWYTSPFDGVKVESSSYINFMLLDAVLYAHWTATGEGEGEGEGEQGWYVGASPADGCAGLGTISGGNDFYDTGKTVSLRADPGSGNLFSGWYEDAAATKKVSTGAHYQEPRFDYVVGAVHTNFYAKFISQESDVASVALALPGELTNGVAMSAVAVDVSGCTSLPTVKVTGLPTGLKFAEKDVLKKGSKTEVEYPVNTIYGTPTRSGVYTVVATVTTTGKKTASASQTVVVRKAGETVVSAEVPTINGVVPGKVTGMGVYVKDKKVTLKATVNKGYVFNGWYEGEGLGGLEGLVTQAASYSFSMPSNDVSFSAKFVTAEEDKASIGATVNGMAFGAVSGGEGAAETKYATNVWAGVYLEWPVAASALSLPTVKVSGLPSGLKFTAKPVTTKVTSGSGKSKVTTVVTNVAANTIYGAPSAASKTMKAKDGSVTVVPTAVKVTVTTAGKNKQTYQIDMTVDPLPAWAVGTFAGPSYEEGLDGEGAVVTQTNGVATVSVAASGKITAKQPVNGKATSFAAKYFDAYDAEGDSFWATLTAKVGSEIVTNVMAVTAAESGMGFIAADRFDAWQYNWKVEPWKTIGKSFDKHEMSYEEDGVKVTLKFSANGTAKVAGEFATYDADGNIAMKSGKPVVVKASGSATLLPTVGEDGETRYLVFVYLAPKGLPPHAWCMEIEL